MIIEEYFGEKHAKECGICDICLKKRITNNNNKSISEQILNTLSSRELTIKELTAEIKGEAPKVVEAIDNLVGEGKISISISGKLKINE